MKDKVKKIVRIVAILICLGVIVYEGINIYLDQREYDVAEKEYESIYGGAISKVKPEDAPEVIEYPYFNINFDKLESINSDLTCWLYFPMLDISYPVVKEKEINEYLYTTFEKNQNKAGCLFEDIVSDENFCGYHDVIFGHNMRNGSMFGKLKQVYQPENKELLESKPYVYVYTKEKVYEYRIFAYYITYVGSGAYTQVFEDEEYDEFLKYISQHSAYAMPEGLDFSDHPSILTLSTCSGKAGGSKRFVIHSVKVNTWDRF